MTLMLIRHFGSMIAHHLRANDDYTGHNKQQSQQRRPPTLSQLRKSTRHTPSVAISRGRCRIDNMAEAITKLEGQDRHLTVNADQIAERRQQWHG
ncbi:Uncharacterised protein [Salmonella enterica subsp. arizonae]|uniref:Uncharacterized protein n=1 Tax=Salmonella enterica subsp. arizonae TaxID=59203 RepID=A0A379T8W1_SALER|nr:Uncharacterised protein [Salmonella enterica subsp. arizonae]